MPGSSATGRRARERARPSRAGVDRRCLSGRRAAASCSPRSGYRAGIDAVLLAAAAPVRRAAASACWTSAPASAWSAWRWRAACADAAVTLVERDAAARRAGARQHRAQRAGRRASRVIEADVSRPPRRAARAQAAGRELRSRAGQSALQSRGRRHRLGRGPEGRGQRHARRQPGALGAVHGGHGAARAARPP